MLENGTQSFWAVFFFFFTVTFALYALTMPYSAEVRDMAKISRDRQ